MYKILVVDDDPNIRIGLSRMIQNAYPDTVITDTAENGRIAFDQVVKFHFDHRHQDACVGRFRAAHSFKGRIRHSSDTGAERI